MIMIMIKKLIWVITLVIPLICYGKTANQNPILSCRVVNIADGDTVTCLTSQKKRIKIRLASIDAPESHQAFGQRSKQHLSQMIAGKKVKVVVQGTDRYHRTLGTIYYRSRNINLQMVKKGMAWTYTQYNHSPRYETAQKQAKKQKLGLWKDANPTPPWEFRKQNKQ